MITSEKSVSLQTKASQSVSQWKIRTKSTQKNRKKELKMDNCIFCKIAGGEIPAATLYEDENFRVILDLGPASKGHALILPKAHAANIYEISDELAAKAMILAKKMARVMTDALHCDGFNIVQNNGECAGQTVFHFHMHLIPRYNGDSVGITWTPGTLTDEAKEEILKKVKAQFS
jgi:histidine triad (HIT) family protein